MCRDFLDGGLFEEPTRQSQTERIREAGSILKNGTFKTVFDDLLEKFNFTVTEDTALDVEVAIDPEMLGKIFESLILQLEEERAGSHPALEFGISLQLAKVVHLAAKAHPARQVGPIAEGPEHRDLVVAEQQRSVGAVAGVAESSDAEWPAVDEVAQEDGVPAFRGVGKEGLEHSLDVPVDVAHHDHRQVCAGLGHAGTRRMLRV